MSALLSHQYESIQISQRPDDGYLSATAMCKAVGKLWGHYFENDSTKAYLSALSGSIGIPTDRLVVKKMNGPNAERGTWVHPKVAIHLAQWLSPEFAVWCTNIIHDWMAGKRVVIKEHRRALPKPKPTRIDPFVFASHIPPEDLMYSAQGHLNDALDQKMSQDKARWHTKVAASCVHQMLNNLQRHGLHTIYRKLVEAEAVKER